MTGSAVQFAFCERIFALMNFLDEPRGKSFILIVLGG